MAVSSVYSAFMFLYCQRVEEADSELLNIVLLLCLLILLLLKSALSDIESVLMLWLITSFNTTDYVAE